MHKDVQIPMADIDALQTVTVPKFCELSGLCMKTVYNMMATGKLKSVKIGRRRLIKLDSWRRIVERGGMRL
jgi:excisionase family DNA binding protein